LTTFIDHRFNQGRPKRNKRPIKIKSPKGARRSRPKTERPEGGNPLDQEWPGIAMFSEQ
jgi:hypothetical protein